MSFVEGWAVVFLLNKCWPIGKRDPKEATEARKVIVRIKGGLGNQLFCYAAARRLALANDAELVIDDVTGFSRDWRYRRRYALDKFNIAGRKAMAWERMEPFEPCRRIVIKRLEARRPFHLRRYVEQENIDFDSRLLDFPVTGTVYLDGYWQGEGYFKDVECAIRNDLRIISPDDSVNKAMAEQIRSCHAVGVHVRWFDTACGTNEGHNVRSSYYAKAIQEIMVRVVDPHFFLFSDDPDAARRIMDWPNDQITWVSHNRGDQNAYADLWLMRQCRHFIIANSTFSWWAAWLAEYQQKIVIAPALVRYSGICAWGFKGLIPDRWVRM